MKTRELLLPFYFGSLTEDERMHVERALLTDAEALTNYLDLKRDLEAASLGVKTPSRFLWERLKANSATRKTLYFSVGAAIAACLAIILLMQTRPKVIEFKQPPVSNVLFDSSSELPLSSGVL
jgi:hypothetical protein